MILFKADDSTEDKRELVNIARLKICENMMKVAWVRAANQACPVLSSLVMSHSLV